MQYLTCMSTYKSLSMGEVYEKGAKDVAISVVHGMKSSVFAYEQTNSGKTYTMTGITEYAISDVYEHIQKTIESASRELVGTDNTSTLTASVNFVDLDGSERASQSLSAGTLLKEGCHINRSLLTLGTVIRKLSGFIDMCY